MRQGLLHVLECLLSLPRDAHLRDLARCSRHSSMPLSRPCTPRQCLEHLVQLHFVSHREPELSHQLRQVLLFLGELQHVLGCREAMGRERRRETRDPALREHRCQRGIHLCVGCLGSCRTRTGPCRCDADAVEGCAVLLDLCLCLHLLHQNQIHILRKCPTKLCAELRCLIRAQHAVDQQLHVWHEQNFLLLGQHAELADVPAIQHLNVHKRPSLPEAFHDLVSVDRG
mmetsp:Transcript_27838/g.65664  ORF Transcript_27838/g.65664 Transcript_27838/m.65664 type:complete len:228 (+) Transcript_27838:353-1036(+)